MNVDWSEFGVDWALLALRIAFVAVLYLFLMQVTKVMLREIRIVAAAKAPTVHVPQSPARPVDERGLIVLDAGDTWLEPGAYFALHGETFLGRGSGNDIYIEDPFISSEHARIIVEPDRTIFVDLGSTNGSRVNGEDVRSPVTLFDGDVVQLGRVRFRYAATVDHASAP
ncbi:MAG: FHA domain-containing protein [Thermomicrobiales bacterium]